MKPKLSSIWLVGFTFAVCCTLAQADVPVAEREVAATLVPLGTSVRDGTVVTSGMLRLSNRLKVAVSNVRVSALANEPVQVSPGVVAISRIEARSEVLADTLITIAYPVPSQEGGNQGQDLEWVVEYTVTEPTDLAAAVRKDVSEGLRLSEIMFYPIDAAADPEWVEIRNDSAVGFAILAGYEIANASDTVYTFPAALPAVPPGGLVLVMFDGKGPAEDDISFDGDNLATLHAGARGVFADEGDICALFAGKSRSAKAMQGFVSWGTVGANKNEGRAKRAKVFSDNARKKGLWNKTAVGVFTSIPGITGPAILMRKGESLVVRDSNGSERIAVPCSQENVTPGRPNPVPAPRLWLPRDGLQTSADLFTFSWHAIGSAVYDIQICRDLSCTNIVVSATSLIPPRFRPVSPLASNVVYFWRVRAIDGNRSSSWSEVRKFTIGYPGAEGTATISQSAAVVINAVGKNPLGVPARAARKDAALLCVDGCNKTEWDVARSPIPGASTITDHSNWYCWAAAAQMLAVYRGGSLCQDEILATVKGSGSTEPEDSLPHGSRAGATSAECSRAVQFALQATDSQVHAGSKPSEAELRAFIDADRPVYYVTQIGAFGHAMVVDGYRTVGSRLEAQFLNTDNDGTIAWQPWADEPFLFCFVPESSLGGRTADVRVSGDADSDGIVDFDEEERFPTSKTSSDSDSDNVPDKADIASYVFRGISADVDGDGKRAEVDADSDNGGIPDGIEDKDHDGVYELAEDETDPHDPDDDARLDLVFCIDTTGSMWDDIAAVKSSATYIINGIAAKLPDFRISVVDYRDFPIYPYGASGDYPYHDVLGFTNNPAAAASAIQSLSLGNGMDWRESVYSALMHCISGASLGGWRTGGVKRAIILMGDAPPHDPEPFTWYTLFHVLAAALIGDVNVSIGSSTDELVAMSMASEALEEAGAVGQITIYSIAIGGDSTMRAYFNALAEGTGGQMFTAANASQVVEAIMEAIHAVMYSPVANAGGPYEGDAGVPIAFDASASYDPDGDIVLYEWDWDSDGMYDASSIDPIIEHTWAAEFAGIIRLRVTDDDGLTAVDTAEVNVIARDTIPPELSLSMEPAVLWPPSHKMVEIRPSWTVRDNADPNPAVTLVLIRSNESEETNAYDPTYDSTLGDGHTTDDILVDATGRIFLRSERSGLGNGRVYTITYRATDASGNVAEASATVTVPHSQR